MSMEMPDNVRERLHIMFGSRLIQANQAAQAYEDLSWTEAAAAGRRKRQKTNNRYVQQGGVIYAKDARKIVRNREDKELREAAYKLDRAQKKVDSIAKKAAWAFHSVIWKEFQGRRSERKQRKEDWAPIWKCIKGRKHALYDKLR
jgi:hypothetical protein